jgi:putative nucleotidyltransferase with HDIG domain
VVKNLQSREEALELIRKHISKKNVVYHMIAVEYIMRCTARHLGDDEDTWGLVGLLHDIDYEKTEATPEKHTLVAEEILKGQVSDQTIRSIKAHNARFTGVNPDTEMEKALVACDAISGLLIACALVMPSKKIEDVKVETIAKKFKDKDFARGADRERIMMCEQLGIPKEQFFGIALEGLKAAGAQIGL